MDINYQHTIDMVLATLKPKEIFVIVRRFGLEDGVPMKFEQIAKMLGVTRQCVNLIEKKALQKLRKPSKIWILKEMMEYFSRNQWDDEVVPMLMKYESSIRGKERICKCCHASWPEAKFQVRKSERYGGKMALWSYCTMCRRHILREHQRKIHGNKKFRENVLW